jgi:hypothetical protein
MKALIRDFKLQKLIFFVVKFFYVIGHRFPCVNNMHVGNSSSGKGVSNDLCININFFTIIFLQPYFIIYFQKYTIKKLANNKIVGRCMTGDDSMLVSRRSVDLNITLISDTAFSWLFFSILGGTIDGSQ